MKTENDKNYLKIGRLLTKNGLGAVGENHCKEIEQLINEHKINVSYVPEKKISLLDWALGFNYVDSNFDAIRLLVAKGADVNYASKLGCEETPLWKSIGSGSVKVVKLFIDKGADVNYCFDERSIWDLCKNSYNTCVHPENKDEIARLIVKSGKLVLKENDEYYNKIKAQVDFETKCENDIQWLKSEKVFSFKILSKMLNFYVDNYKTKFAKEIKLDDEFCENYALKVKDAIKLKFRCESNKDSINNIFSSSEEGGIKFNEVPGEVFDRIGKFVFEGTFYDIDTSGNFFVDIIEN